jgi:hypothetical protein
MNTKATDPYLADFRGSFLNLLRWWQRLWSTE